MIKVENGEVTLSGTLVQIQTDITIVVMNFREMLFRDIPIDSLRDTLLEITSDTLIDALYMEKEQFMAKQCSEVISALDRQIKKSGGKSDDSEQEEV